ncbi:MAG: PQQ-binding-like beta-propeller repeat protein [Pirellulaceae bacterium]
MTRSAFSVLLLLVVAGLAPAQEWARFRGPNGSGISDAKTVPVAFGENDINWKVKLPGVGNSSPIAWGDHVYVTSATDDPPMRTLSCLDAKSGAVRWRREVPFESYKKHKNNSFASNTPCADADHVYVLWQSKSDSPLVAFNHDGEEVWRYDLGPYNHGQGGGTSPIVYDNLVIVCNDHSQGSFLLALDRCTGKEVWKVPRQGKRACYATPCIYQAGDRPAEIIFSHCFEGVSGVDPQTGRQNWSIHVFGDFPQRAVGSPFIIDDLVVSNSGALVADKNLVAVRPHADGDGVRVEEVYRLTRGAPHVPSAIAYRGLLFAWNDQGIVTCLDARDGGQIWQKRVGGNYFSSPICIDGKLYCVDVDGTVVVIAASDQYEELARNPLGEPSMATPAVSGGTLFVRTESQLFSIGGPERE